NNDIVLGGNFDRIAPNPTTAPVTRYNIARIKPDGSIDAAFDPSTNGVVLALAQDGDKLLVGGFFTVLRPNGATEAEAIARDYIVRLNADGSVDTAFNLNIDDAPGNVVSSIAKTSDNKMLIGGAFSSIGGVNRNRIARIANGVVDPAFNADLGSAGGPAVHSIATESSGRVLVA